MLNIRGGVEIDDDGVPVAYHIRRLTWATGGTRGKNDDVGTRQA